MKTNVYVLAPLSIATLFVLSTVTTPAFAQAAPESEATRTRAEPPAAPTPHTAPPTPPPTPPPSAAVAAPAPTPVGPVRDGFTIGFSAGIGQLATSSDSIGGGGLSFRLGVALNPSVLLQAHVESIAADDSGATIYETFTGATVTGFLGPRFYLGGGLGRVELSVHDSGGRKLGSQSSGGALLLLGLEVYQSPSFALSIESRGYFADFDGETVSAGGISLGLQWF